MNILWIDDDWESDSKKQALENEKQKIEDSLLQDQIVVKWDCCANSSVAYKKIDQKNKKIHFVIIDALFVDNQDRKQDTDVNELIDKLIQAKMHFAVYSGIANKVKAYSNYCVGRFKKDANGADSFISNIRMFFSFPPIRILQISDLHFDLRINTHTRDELLRSLDETVQKIDNERKIDVVAIAGDIVATKPAAELHIVGDSLKYILFDSLKLNEDRVFIVPGNHEMIWDDFNNKKLDEFPYSGFVTFLQGFYGRSILKTIKGCGKNGLLSSKISSDELAWHRTLPMLSLSIIGICSCSSNPENQGCGFLSLSSINFIKEKWGILKKNPSETRILLMHHNIFPVQSFDSRDENRTIINSGVVLNTLTEFDCDFVLSGHTHRPESVLYESSSLFEGGYKKNKTLMLISSGTSGGVSPTGDLSKSFNIIDIFYSLELKKRVITITPFLFNSRNTRWCQFESIDYYL